MNLQIGCKVSNFMLINKISLHIFALMHPLNVFLGNQRLSQLLQQGLIGRFHA